MIYTEMESSVALDGEAAGYRRLWAGVLLQAIRDISAVDNVENGIRDTRAGGFSAIHLKDWFASDAMTVGAFAWICSHLGHNHVRIREVVAKNPQVLTGTRK